MWSKQWQRPHTKEKKILAAVKTFNAKKYRYWHGYRNCKYYSAPSEIQDMDMDTTHLICLHSFLRFFYWGIKNTNKKYDRYNHPGVWSRWRWMLCYPAMVLCIGLNFTFFLVDHFHVATILICFYWSFYKLSMIQKIELIVVARECMTCRSKKGHCADLYICAELFILTNITGTCRPSWTE